ncbi:lipocalin-like domain-containing protein (plasmid) [Rhizobium etli]|uniref:Lipocalin-like domain-containing protein n=2 Tax=Rhizobium etli TaxID=29449 RepID=A0AAN1BL82_RHIET|nr:lipocalin-like domain-containing protein [Rhizobium etli]
MVTHPSVHPALVDTQTLTGSWKLTRWVMEDMDTKEQKASPFGERPDGYVFFSSSNRMFVLITAENRKPAEGADEQSAAFRSLYTYSGKYRLESGRFITKIDIAGDQNWVGSEQQRSYRINGDTLIIESAPATQAGKMVRGILEWEREP